MKSDLTYAGSVEDLALDLGATVLRPDGNVFNAAGRAGAARLPKSDPPKEGYTPPTTPSNNEEVLRKLIELVAQKMSQPSTVDVKLPAIEIPAPTVVVQPAARTGWEFEFKRNKDGSIQKIVATPLKE